MTDARPVDVISVCNAEGAITPLRLQLEDEERQLLRMRVKARKGTVRKQRAASEKN